MKNLVLILMTFLFQSQALAGNEIANGGDAISAQFISTGQFLLENWKDINLPANLNIEREKFRTTLKTAIVETQETVELDGRIVDAINIPSKNRIVVNRTRWPHLTTFDRLTVVFHEYLGLFSDVDRNFEVTPAALKSFDGSVDVIARTADLLITTLTLPDSKECPQLIGSWSKCEIETDIPGLSLEGLFIKRTVGTALNQYDIDSKINGLSSEAIPGGRSTGENTKVTCEEKVLSADHRNLAGEVISHSEMARLGKDIYLFLAITDVGTAAITCQ